MKYTHYLESAEYISEKLGGEKPGLLMILGSGIGFMADEVTDAAVIPYVEVPNLRGSTAPGHRGRFVFGGLSGKKVLVMDGRLHMYEGYTAEEAAFPVRVAKLLGAESMVITNAAGGVNLNYSPGDIMVISDFIGFGAPSPLTGPNISEFGVRFPDMTRVFDRGYAEEFRLAAARLGGRVHEGVYFYTSGPMFETPAEIRAVRALGGDAVGMSTVPECIAAAHAGMRVLGLSLITNMAAGVTGSPLSGEEVNDTAGRARESFSALMYEFLKNVRL